MALRIPRHIKISAAIGAVIAVCWHVFFEYMFDPLYFDAPNAEVTLRNCTDVCKLYGDVTVDWDGRYRVVQKDGTIVHFERKNMDSISWTLGPKL